MSRARVVAGTAVAPADRYRWVMLGLVWSLYFVFGLIAEVGGFTGPLLIGLTLDLTGGFGLGLLGLAAVCGLLALLSLSLGPAEPLAGPAREGGR